MSDTPRTDKIENDWKESWDRSTGQAEMACFARQLERELNEVREKIEATSSLKVELGNRNSEICKLRSINAELRQVSIDLLKSLPIVGCSELHHEKADQHTFMEDCPVLFRYKSAIDQMRITLVKSKNKPNKYK